MRRRRSKKRRRGEEKQEEEEDERFVRGNSECEIQSQMRPKQRTHIGKYVRRGSISSKPGYVPDVEDDIRQPGDPKALHSRVGLLSIFF